MPAKTVMIILPAWVVVSAQGSQMDLEPGACHADHFEQVAGGPRQPVELPDGDNVSVSQTVEHPVQLGPVAVGSRDLFARKIRVQPASLSPSS